MRWAGVQENWGPLHFDRDHVRKHNGLRTFIDGQRTLTGRCTILLPQRDTAAST